MSLNNWQPVIGLEVHVQLATRTKLFSSSPIAFGADPNTQASEIDLGLPGVLPVLNKEAISHALKFGCAINAEISEKVIFARKNYFYPDLPKGYQISQLDDPIVGKGSVEIKLGDKSKIIGVTRAHLEEDAGKSIHDLYSNNSAIDLNRAGTCLLEIVSEPDLSSAEEAVEYLKKIHSIVTFLGISDGDMSQGSMRCDANVSVKRPDDQKLGTRTELKNINSFKFVEKAIIFEIDRQIKDVRKNLPELPEIMKERFMNSYELSDDNAELVTINKETASFFEEVLSYEVSPKNAVNWITGDLFALLNKNDTNISESKVNPKHIAEIIQNIEDQKISGPSAKKLLEIVWSEGGEIQELIQKEGLEQISNDDEIEKILDEVISENQKQFEQLKSGKDRLQGFFVGQVMKKTSGSASPQVVNKLLKDKLSK